MENLTDVQKEIVALTLQLELETRKFSDLNKRLDELKLIIDDPNAKEFVEIRKEYAKNYLEIEKINKRLKELNSK